MQHRTDQRRPEPEGMIQVELRCGDTTGAIWNTLESGRQRRTTIAEGTQ